MKDYPQNYRRLKEQVKALHEAAPGPMTRFRQLHQEALKAGALDTKTKALIALAIAVTVRCDGCVAYHVADAIHAGATREEVAESLGVAVLMGGGPSAMYGAEALAAFDDFVSSPRMWAG